MSPRTISELIHRDAPLLRDDMPLAAAVSPALSTATHPVERIATAAARAALGMPSASRLFPSHPVLRSTT